MSNKFSTTQKLDEYVSSDEEYTIYKLMSETIKTEDDESDTEYLPEKDEINQIKKEEEEDEENIVDYDEYSDDDYDDYPRKLFGYGQQLTNIIDFLLNNKNMPYYENIEWIVETYDKWNGYNDHLVHDGCYNEDVYLKAHELLDRLLRDDDAFGSHYKDCKILLVVSTFFIPELQDEFSEYLDLLMYRLFDILDGEVSNSESKFPGCGPRKGSIHEASIDLIMQLFDEYGEEMLEYCDELLEKLIANRKKFPEVLLCQALYGIFLDLGNDLKSWHESVIKVIDEIAFRKENEDHSRLLDIFSLSFYYLCFEQDIQLVFERKFEIIELITSRPNDPFDDELNACKLLVITKLLLYCDIKIYIAMDSNDKISEIIQDGYQSESNQIKILSENIEFLLEKQKSNLRKFLIVNGYSKQLK